MNRESKVLLFGILFTFCSLVIGIGIYPDSRDAPKTYVGFVSLCVGIGLGMLLSWLWLTKSHSKLQISRSVSERRES